MAARQNEHPAGTAPPLHASTPAGASLRKPMAIGGFESPNACCNSNVIL
jgi:hypothetical protein